MPLVFEGTPPADGLNGRNTRRYEAGTDQTKGLTPQVLTIGLVNNMKDGALETTERQFYSLLDEASEGMTVRLRLYQLPGMSRGKVATRHIQECYSDIDTLWETQLDGLIVTGREPMNAHLQDESYWKDFVRLLEWARHHTASTIWSCLAAHAAVLHMDDIRRIPNTCKHSGLFTCDTLSSHRIIEGLPSRVVIPHSRWNGLDEKRLLDRDYEVLTVSTGAGIDAFIKENESLFVFFQGHPEYDPHTLSLEYRRDVTRYLRGQVATYPSMPRAYFDDDTVEALGELQRSALLLPRETMIRDLSLVLESAVIKTSWRKTAVLLYRNWLRHVAAARGVPLILPSSKSRSDTGLPLQRVSNSTESGILDKPMPLQSIH